MIFTVEWATYGVEKEPEKIPAWLGKPEFFQGLSKPLRLFIVLQRSCSLSYNLYLFLQFRIWFILYISKHYSISVGPIFLSSNKENIKDLSSGSFFKFSLKILSSSEDQNTASISLGLPLSTWSDIFTELLCLLTFCLNNLCSQNSML